MGHSNAALETSLPTDVPRLTGQECAAWSVGGAPPDVVAFPTSTSQVADILRIAQEQGWSVCAAGGGAFLIASLRSSPVSLVVSVRRIASIVHYQPADLVMTVGAGTPLGRIQERAAGEGQFLALDPTAGPDATIGAVAASASAGPLIPGFGRAKDLILGATLVTGDGRVLELGGRVVKNVAGFDLLKLAVGSGGRLGVITEVSVRLHGLPTHDRVRIYRGSSTEMMQTARALATAREMPSSLELVCPDTCAALGLDEGDSEQQWGLLLRVMGNPLAVEAAVAIFDTLAGEPRRQFSAAEAQGLMSLLGRLGTSSGLSARMSLPPARLSDLLHCIEDLRLAFSGIAVAVHVTEGLARLELDREAASRLSTDQWAHFSNVRARVNDAGGALWLSGAAPEALATVSPRIDRPDASALRQRLIGSFDPHGVLGGAHGIA